MEPEARHHLDRLTSALSDPAAFPRPAGAVSVRQTHASILFFTDDRVYKVKKPVDLGFLDFSTLDKRRHFCEEEVRLNRRLAPETYLGVVPILRDPDGRVRVGSADDCGRADVIDFAVLMQRLPDDGMLSARLARDEADPAVFDDLAELIARFHERAATGPDVNKHGSPEAIGAVATENLDDVRRFAGDVRSGWINRDDEYTLDEAIESPANHSARLHGFLHRQTEQFLEANAPFLAARVAEGRIREGHGDLHAGNICLTDVGFVIYDCIEFTPRFRCADVAAEVAFLGADLDAAGLPELADRFTDAYARRSRDPGVGRLQGFYRRHFAAVRGKVASIRSTDTGLTPRARALARREAMRYFQLAASYGGAGFQPARPDNSSPESNPPPLILTCGLPASGKSSAARAIALALRATTLRSDAVRKQLAGMAPTDRPADPDALYSPEMSDRTYRRLLDGAQRLLAAGRPAVVDAMFPTPRRREQFARLARAAGARLIAVHVRCPEEAIRRRMARRADDASEVSDADWNIYLSARDDFQEPTELPGAITADGALPPETAAAAVMDALLE